ncbi:MAG TPA: ABC transporter substrate-binding protein [Chloroflexota bacterium]|jgi:NitT/TauT family transport system substrate-binding protein
MRGIAWLTCALAAIALLTSCSQGAAPATSAASAKPAASAGTAAKPKEMTTLRVATQTNQGDFGYLPLWIAVQQGYLKDEGIQLQYVTMQQSASIAALLNHEIDISADTSRPASQGAPAKNFMWYYNTTTFQFSVSPEIQKPQDLLGKAVGIASPGATQDKATRLIIEKALGLDPNKVQYHPLGSPQARIAAMEAKQIVGSANNPDVAALLETMGYKTIANSAKVMPVPFSPLGAHTDLFKDKPEMLKSFLKANLRAAKFLHDNPEESAKIAGGFAKDLAPGVALRAVQLDLGAMDANDYLGATQDGLQLDANAIKDEQSLATPPGLDALINVVPLRAAQKELGLSCAGGWKCDH